MAKALIIGETPFLVYLNFILSTSKWEVATYRGGGQVMGHLAGPWTGPWASGPWMLLTEREHYECDGKIIAKDEVTALLQGNLIDYVFMAPGMSYILESGFNKNTILIIDAKEDLWVHGRMKERFPSNIVVSMSSEVDCRCIDQRYVVVDDGLGLQLSDEYELDELINVVEKSCDVTVLNRGSCLWRSLIWLNIMGAVCFDATTLLFDQPDIWKLALEPESKPTVWGLFNEMLTLQHECEPVFNSERIAFDSSTLSLVLMLEQNKQLKRSAIISKIDHLPQNVDSSRTIYNLEGGFHMDVMDTLAVLLERAHFLNINVPYLTSTYNNIKDVIEGRKTNLKALHENSTSEPSTPLSSLEIGSLSPMIFMSAVHVADYPSDAESEEGREAIKELLVGRQELTFGSDQFYDASEAQHSELRNSLGHSDEIRTSRPLRYRHNTSPLPQFPTLFTDSNGNYHILQPTGAIIPVTPVYNRNGHHEHRQGINQLLPKTYPYPARKTSFHHVPSPITRHTSSQKLKESHINMMELIGITEQETSSRYGEVDTSSVILNSTSNSRTGSGRSSITPTKITSQNSRPNSTTSLPIKHQTQARDTTRDNNRPFDRHLSYNSL